MATLRSQTRNNHKRKILSSPSSTQTLRELSEMMQPWLRSRKCPGLKELFQRWKARTPAYQGLEGDPDFIAQGEIACEICIFVRFIHNQFPIRINGAQKKGCV